MEEVQTSLERCGSIFLITESFTDFARIELVYSHCASRGGMAQALVVWECRGGETYRL